MVFTCHLGPGRNRPGQKHPELSVDYYDGQGPNALSPLKEQIEDFRGGPLTDGVPIAELNKMVGLRVDEMERGSKRGILTQN